MTPFDQILQATLSKSKNTVKGITSVDVAAKGLSLAGSIELRLEKELPEEEADSLADKALAAALLRIEDIIEGVISQNVLDSKFFTSTTRSKALGKVDVPTKIGGLRASNGRFISAVSLAQILNIGLFQHVKDLMVAPALVNRTGRFAHSAHINAITTSTDKANKSRGSIYFSYMLLPYSVFAGHSTRDPSSLIRTAISAALRKALSPASFKQANFNIQEKS